MLAKKTVSAFLDELASSSPAPGGGSVAALSGALGAALTTMVCNLTIGKKKYVEVEGDLKKVKAETEKLRARFTELIDEDTQAFNKVMEAYALPKDSEAQKTIRSAAIAAATKEATLIPLEVMKHCIDAMALAQQVASSGNSNSVSDAGVAAQMLHAACEGAALNVKINLNALADSDFIGWKSDEVGSLLKTSRMMVEETMEMVAAKIRGK
jgi:formiminotetrahydrofolate cyclodeaminase